jgi:hypothetical protein
VWSVSGPVLPEDVVPASTCHRKPVVGLMVQPEGKVPGDPVVAVSKFSRCGKVLIVLVQVCAEISWWKPKNGASRKRNKIDKRCFIEWILGGKYYFVLQVKKKKLP